MKHIKSIAKLEALLGDKILVLGREFSYELVFVGMAESDTGYAIRLNVGNNPTIRGEGGSKVSLTKKALTGENFGDILTSR